MAGACPRCGFASVESDKCPQCGVVVTSYAAALEKMRRGPAGPAAVRAPAVVPTAPRPVASRTGVAPAVRRLAFHGSGGTLFGIHIVNILFMLLTLGVYSFWGRVRIRRYLLGQTSFEGDRFAYHGTGRELFFGFLKALLFVGVPVGVLSAVPLFPGAGRWAIAAQVLTYALAMVFVPVAMVGAHRYRLSRTSWRGIRFSFRGRTWDFVKLFGVGAILTLLTLSLYSPVWQTRMRAFLVGHAYFGQRRFRFEAGGRELVGPYALALLLTVPTLGLCWFWYLARRTRLYWEHTTFETTRFRSAVTGRLLLNLIVGNLILRVLTLGLASPWVRVRNARFTAVSTTMAGPLDLDTIVQEPQPALATGDALSTLLGAEVDLG